MNMYDHAMEFKKKLENHDKQTLEAVGIQYNATLNRLSREFEKLAQEVSQSPEPPTKHQLNQMASVKKAMEDIESRMNELHIEVANTIKKSEQIVAENVSKEAERTFKEVNKLIGSDKIQFNRINPEAYEKMIGFTQEGTPLNKVLDKYSPYSDKGAIISILREGVLRGKNPNQIANEMVKLGYQDKSHALLVARTEVMRVAHEVGIENFRKNGVEKVQWVSGETSATCATCWAMSGKIFDIDNIPHDHPNGRCTFNPYFEDLAEMDPDAYDHNPEDAFNDLDEEEQKQILGAKRFDLWKTGEISLEDLATVKENKDYGKQVTLKPVDKIKEIENIEDDSESPATVEDKLDDINRKNDKAIDNVLSGYKNPSEIKDKLYNDEKAFWDDPNISEKDKKELLKLSKLETLIGEVINDKVGNKKFVDDVFSSDLTNDEKIRVLHQYVNFKNSDKDTQADKLQKFINAKDKLNRGYDILVNVLTEKYGKALDIIDFPAVIDNIPDQYGEAFINSKYGIDELHDYCKLDRLDRRREYRQVRGKVNRHLGNALEWVSGELDNKDAVIKSEIKFNNEFLKKYNDLDVHLYKTLREFTDADLDGKKALIDKLEKKKDEKSQLLCEEYKRIEKTLKKEYNIDGEFQERFDKLDDVHKELFAPYLQKGNVDRVFDTNHLTDEEKANPFYMDNFDMAIKMQEILENGFDFDLRDDNNKQKINKKLHIDSGVDIKLLKGELLKDDLDNMPISERNKLLGKTIVSLINGTDVKYAYNTKHYDFNINYDDIFNNGKIKPIYKIIVDAQRKLDNYPAEYKDFSGLNYACLRKSYLYEFTDGSNAPRSNAMKLATSVLYNQGVFFYNSESKNAYCDLNGEHTRIIENNIRAENVLFAMPIIENFKRHNYYQMIKNKQNGGKIPNTNSSIKNNKIFLYRGMKIENYKGKSKNGIAEISIDEFKKLYPELVSACVSFTDKKSKAEEFAEYDIGPNDTKVIISGEIDAGLIITQYGSKTENWNECGAYGTSEYEFILIGF